jgi:hypothetical protein
MFYNFPHVRGKFPSTNVRLDPLSIQHFPQMLNCYPPDLPVSQDRDIEVMVCLCIEPCFSRLTIGTGLATFHCNGKC